MFGIWEQLRKSQGSDVPVGLVEAAHGRPSNISLLLKAPHSPTANVSHGISGIT
jgi:K+-sensing histidine kinase KdpD